MSNAWDDSAASGDAGEASRSAAGGASRPCGTALFSSELCERHAPPAHPEAAERVRVVDTRLALEFPHLRRVSSSPPATREQLLLFHTQEYVDSMFAAFKQVRSAVGKDATLAIDDDTVVTAGTEAAALAAVGSVCHAVDLVMKATAERTGGGGGNPSGEGGSLVENHRDPKEEDPSIVNAFCCVRPPGHHAEPDRAMGFCFFNNVGIGALHVLQTYASNVSRVLIVDFDVHHGNGTQAKFITSKYPNVKYISTHQSPFFPKTGKRHERGVSGNILNVPLVEGTGTTAFRRLFTAKVAPAMEQFKPDFVFISAGFDAHEDDPLANICLQHEDFYWMTKHIVDVAWKFARGRVVSVLEGGYDLEALPLSAAAHVRALVEGSKPPSSIAAGDDIDALTAAFASSVRVASSAAPPDLRVVVHLDAREKLIVLKGERSVDALLELCQHKFNFRRTRNKPSRTLLDRHGAPLTLAALQSLPNDQHLYLR